MERITKASVVLDTISKLEVNEAIDKVDFIKCMYNEYNYFVARSFDVIFAKAKSKLPGRKFKTLKGMITRIK